MEYHWVFGRKADQNGVVLGPYEQTQADLIADKLEDGRVFSLPTKDQSRATQMIKAELFGKSQDIEQATKQVGHSLESRKKPSEFRGVSESQTLVEELRTRL